MENILAEAQKSAEAAEVFRLTAEETPVQFEANRLKHIQSKQSSYTALRIIKNGRTGYAISTGTSDVPELVNTAVETAQFGIKTGFELPPLTPYPDIKILDPAVASVSLDEMVGLGEEMIASVRGYNRDILCQAEVNKEITSVRIINSYGGEVNYKQSTFALGIEGHLIRDTDMLFVGESASSCHPVSETSSITDVVLRQLELARNQARLEGKRMPVIFTPSGVASALMPPLMAAFNGKTVLEGASPIGNRIGEPVFDSKLSLRDDPTIDYRPESRPADDEGIPSRYTPLVEEGRIANFIYDLQTAALAGTRSTGNGTRSSSGMLAPAPTSFIITTGKTAFAEMVNDVKEGLLIEYLMGAAQGNILSGDFSGNVLLGYKIENGKIVGRVKDTMVSGNVYRLLKEITAVGSDAKWEGGSIYTPSLYCPVVSVAVKQ
ncbi:MAG: TldD/PmbA family protein [Dehalococcoidales bacterium]|nr:TldD/PmbA family protein [Dehalococcoidales bacterium]